MTETPHSPQGSSQWQASEQELVDQFEHEQERWPTPPQVDDETVAHILEQVQQGLGDSDTHRVRTTLNQAHDDLQQHLRDDQY